MQQQVCAVCYAVQHSAGIEDKVPTSAIASGPMAHAVLSCACLCCVCAPL